MIKNLASICVLVFLAACGNPGSTASAVGSATAPIPPVNSRETGLLARDYWVFEFYVVPNNQQASKEGRGKWYKFYPDGRFDSGHWDQTLSSGSWGIGFRNEGTVLHIDAMNDVEDSEYIIQVNASGDEMSWVGTSTYEQDGIMLKSIHLLSQPTKAQFGLE